MALIICSECGKDISDKSNKCIHCGNPIVPDPGNNDDIHKEELQNQNAEGNKFNKIAVSVVVILALIVGIYAYYSAVETKRIEETYEANYYYITNIIGLKSMLYVGSYESDIVSNLIQAIWYNSIYEISDERTNKYTMTNGRFNEEFSDSLEDYIESDECKASVIKINEYHDSIVQYVVEIQNPPQNLEYLYDTVSELFEIYLVQYQNATSASGTLANYTSSVNESKRDFMIVYDKLDAQIPDYTSIPESN